MNTWSQAALVLFLLTASVAMAVSVVYVVKTLKRIEAAVSSMERLGETVSGTVMELKSELKGTLLPRTLRLAQEAESAVGRANDVIAQAKDKMERLDHILHDGEVAARSLRTTMLLLERVLGSPLINVGGFVGGIVKGFQTVRRLRRLKG
ncbi:MAG TPA: DUF948 domain-containing protein [Clostridia bacterium]|nr:DUF948 domain-containing protein [Clostridia bacterium]